MPTLNPIPPAEEETVTTGDDFFARSLSALSVKSVVGDPTNLVLEDGEIVAENINPLLIHDPVSDVGVFVNGFWNLSEVGFLNQADVEMVDLNPTQVKSIDGIQLVVDLDLAEKTKEMGKGNWKHKSTEKMLGIPKSKKKVERKKKKCVVFRSAIAAAALSAFSRDTNRLHLDDAKTTWSIEKILGEDYLGVDEEALSKFMIDR
ncbi:hypothetical protein RHMOL_Rhmol13G0074300 [Rhododendron molle]|uniref:Uncharacterized protein n=1 Tax=Rhododendron molle TaxID=49168 RepID=A0ACC0L4H3_RHOML|nr:hypothetical protein RHMOL_Rhmol13G0074300 [Rhododendron molle]